MTDQPAMPIALLDWREFRRNSLLGFASCRLGKSLVIRDVSVHRKGDRTWASLPSKPQVDRDGTVRRDDDGKIRYTPILEWSDKSASYRFSDALVAAIEEQHPGATR